MMIILGGQSQLFFLNEDILANALERQLNTRDKSLKLVMDAKITMEFPFIRRKAEMIP